MSTVIDSLVVLLTLDRTRFKKASDESNKDLRQLKDNAKDSVEQVKKLTIAVVGLFAAFTAGRGLKEFVEDITSSNTQLERLSRNVGESVDNLSAWGAVVARNGGSAQGFQQTMAHLSMQMTEIAVTGQSSVLPYFRALGVHLGDATGHARPLTEILLETADRLSAMPRTTANNIGLMMGFDQGTVNALLQGRRAVEEMLIRQRQLNPVTQRQAEQSERLTKAMFDFRQAAEAMGRSLLVLVTPALTRFFEMLTGAFEWLSQHRGLLAGIAVTLAATLAPALWTAAAAVAAFVAPWLIAAAPVLAVGAAIALLADDWETFEKGGRSAFGSFWQAWDDLWKKIGDSGPMIDAAIKKATGWVGDVVSTAAAGFKEDGLLGGVAGALQGAFGHGTYVNQRALMGQLRSEGYSPAQAAGMTAVMFDESGLDPTKVNKDSGAYGIGQWLGSRKSQLFQFAAANGLDPSSLGAQLAFRRWEELHGDPGAMKTARAMKGETTAEGAASLYRLGNERPGPDVEAARSIKDAALAGHLATMDVAASPVGVDAKGSITSSSSTSETHIGQIVVHTQATDAKGIAATIGPAIRQNDMSNQADYGPN